MKTLTKKNVLKLTTAALVFLFAANVVNAQGVADGNYVDATGFVTHHTINKTAGFYAEPDAFYNPDYIAPDWILNIASIWTWTYDGDPVDAAGPANYVEFVPDAVGNFVLSVTESNTTSGCAGAAVNNTVVVLPAPTMEVGLGGITNCGDLTEHEISFTIEAEGLAGHIWAQWRLQEFVVTVDGATGDLEVGDQQATDQVFTWNGHTASPQTINGISWTMTDDGGFVGDGTNAPELAEVTIAGVNDYPLPVGQQAYLYRWVIDTGEGDGVNDRISRKSDYVAGGTTIYGTDGEIDIYIVRAPVTGPIYHIPDTWAQ